VKHVTEVFAMGVATPGNMSRVAVFQLPNEMRVRAIHWDSFTVVDGDNEEDARKALFEHPQYRAHHDKVNAFQRTELSRIDFQKKEA